MLEADRLIKCPYCDNHNYMAGPTLLRCVLPDRIPSQVSERDIRYIPYIRFKGQVYYQDSSQLQYKIIDTTQLGVDCKGCSQSLGLRPQAMKIKPVSADLKGKFMIGGDKVEAIRTQVTRLLSVGRNKRHQQNGDHTYIGETVSVVYLPTYIQDGAIYDGVLDRPMAQLEENVDIKGKLKEFRDDWHPRFLSTICPNCGDSLHGEHDSVVLLCFNCERVYQESNGRFVGVDWSVIRSMSKETIFLPFWRILIQINGLLTTFGDLLRLTNQRVTVPGKSAKDDLSFLVPGFKLNPKTFLQSAVSHTLVQHRIPPSVVSMEDNMHPVTFPVAEAEQALGVVLAAMSMNKRMLFKSMAGLSFMVRRYELLYLPYNRHGNDFVSDLTGRAIPSHVLRYSRSL